MLMFPVCTGRADVVQKGIISVHDAEELVRTFQTDYTGFPFVLLPYLTMDSFRRERPFLLLSVLAITSRKQLELQEPLEREFREVLGYEYFRVVVLIQEFSKPCLRGSKYFTPSLCSLDFFYYSNTCDEKGKLTWRY